MRSSTGLSAAKLLKANGLNPVVLEARSRVGGRTFTVRVRLGPFSYGCTVHARVFMYTRSDFYLRTRIRLAKILLNANDNEIEQINMTSLECTHLLSYGMIIEMMSPKGRALVLIIRATLNGPEDKAIEHHIFICEVRSHHGDLDADLSWCTI